MNDESTLTVLDPKTLTPKMYNVLLLNDDYSSMDFVVSVLIKIFNKTHSEAENITMEIHRQGRGLAGRYPKDIAETKVLQVKSAARSHGFPLQAISEEA